MDDLTIKELIQLISEYPNLLRRPIIMDNKRMQIGFNEDEIRAFFCLVIIESKNCVKRPFELKLRVTMTKGNYSYPLDPSWSTEEITTVLHFFESGRKKHTRAKVDRDQPLQAL